eukprot:bmy_21004T0
MSKAHPPELKKFMDRKLSLKLNGGRHVQGILRGFDPFMNLVRDECVEMATSGQQNNIGMVAIRGNSIINVRSFGTSLNNGCLHQRNQLLPHVPSPHFTTMKIESFPISPLHQQQLSFPESGQAKYPANFDPDIKGVLQQKAFEITKQTLSYGGFQPPRAPCSLSVLVLTVSYLRLEMTVLWTTGCCSEQ